MANGADLGSDLKRIEKMVADLGARYEETSKKVDKLTNSTKQVRAAHTKLNASTLNLTAKLEAQGKTWTDLGIKQSLVTKSLRGHRESTEDLQNYLVNKKEQKENFQFS